MTTRKELKQELSGFHQKARKVRRNLKFLVIEAKAADETAREELFNKIDKENSTLNGLLRKIDELSLEIKARKAKSKPKKKKGGKVHNVSGRYIDPKGFSGVVQGGSPGGGKRR